MNMFGVGAGIVAKKAASMAVKKKAPAGAKPKTSAGGAMGAAIRSAVKKEAHADIQPAKAHVGNYTDGSSGGSGSFGDSNPVVSDHNTLSPTGAQASNYVDKGVGSKTIKGFWG